MTGAETGRPRRRRALVFCVLVPTILFLLTPVLISRAARERTAGFFEEYLGVPGHVEGFSFSYLSGVSLDQGSFHATDGCLRVHWNALRCDLSSWDLFWSGRPGEVEIEGLEMECSDWERWAEAPPHLPRDIPHVRARGGRIRWVGGPEAIELSDVRIATEPGEDRASSDVFLTAIISIGEDARRLAGRLGFSARTSPQATEVSVDITELQGSLPLAEPEATGPFTAVELQEGEASLRLQASGDRSTLPWREWLSAWRGEARIVARSIATQTMELAELSLRAEMERGRAEIGLERSTLNGGDLEGRGQVDLADGSWEADVEANGVASTPELVYLLARVSPVFVLAQNSPGSTECRVGGAVDLQGCYTEARSALSGTGTLAVSDGSIEAPPELTPLLQLLSGTTDRELRFDAHEQPLRIHEDRVECEGFRWQTRPAGVDVEGHTTLDGQLSHRFRLDPEVTRALQERDDAPAWARSLIDLLANGALHLEGPVTAPRLRMPSMPTAPGILRRFLGDGSERP